MNKHEHEWQFLREYNQVSMKEPYHDIEMMLFVCHCGLIKSVEKKYG